RMIGFYTGKDRAAIDTLFRCSKLDREKWDRADYRENTFKLVLDDPTFTWWGDTKTTATAASDTLIDWAIRDFADLDSWEFPLPTMLIDGLLPERGLVWLGADPKVGKSLLVEVLGLTLHTGQDRAFDHEPFRVLARPAVLWLSEDDGGLIKARA